MIVELRSLCGMTPSTLGVCVLADFKSNRCVVLCVSGIVDTDIMLPERTVEKTKTPLPVSVLKKKPAQNGGTDSELSEEVTDSESDRKTDGM